MQDEFKNKTININEALDKETKDLMKHMLKVDINDRCDIDWILNHPALRNRHEEFQQPLTEPEFTVLLRNYILNTKGDDGRDFPDSLNKVIDVYKEGNTVQEKTVEMPVRKESLDSNAIQGNGFFSDVSLKDPKSHRESIVDYFEEVRNDDSIQPKETSDSRIQRNSQMGQSIPGNPYITARGHMFESKFNNNFSPSKFQTSPLVHKDTKTVQTLQHSQVHNITSNVKTKRNSDRKISFDQPINFSKKKETVTNTEPVFVDKPSTTYTHIDLRVSKFEPALKYTQQPTDSAFKKNKDKPVTTIKIHNYNTNSFYKGGKANTNPVETGYKSNRRSQKELAQNERKESNRIKLDDYKVPVKPESTRFHNTRVFDSKEKRNIKQNLNINTIETVKPYVQNLTSNRNKMRGGEDKLIRGSGTRFVNANFTNLNLQEPISRITQPVAISNIKLYKQRGEDVHTSKVEKKTKNPPVQRKRNMTIDLKPKPVNPNEPIRTAYVSNRRSTLMTSNRQESLFKSELTVKNDFQPTKTTFADYKIVMKNGRKERVELSKEEKNMISGLRSFSQGPKRKIADKTQIATYSNSRQNPTQFKAEKKPWNLPRTSTYEFGSTGNQAKQDWYGIRARNRYTELQSQRRPDVNIQAFSRISDTKSKNYTETNRFMSKLANQR